MGSRPYFSSSADTKRPQLSRQAETARSGKSSSGGKGPVSLLTTDWVEHFIRIKNGDTGQVDRFDFKERRYLRRIYNTQARRVLLMTSRQTEKSTTLGNKLIALSGQRNYYNSLFVTPSAMQTTVFSKSRLDDIIDVSPNAKALTHKSLTMNILEKEFITKSKIYLRYAFLSADRIRGLSVNSIFADEIQDLLRDVMPVIEETASRFAEPFFLYSGTPKTIDNTIEHYWSAMSTQSEWVIPCEHHGTPNNPSSWHWNVLGIKNLGKTGPICDKCGNLIDPEHPLADWVAMKPGAEFEGYRVCRLMVPWFAKNEKKWKDILSSYESYPRAQFMNEVMAVSYDSGTKPLTATDMLTACDPNVRMNEDDLVKVAQNWQLYAGVDWGTGSEKSYTVLTIGGYTRSDHAFQVLFSKRYDGLMADPELQVADIIQICRRLNVKYIGADWGLGLMPNKNLVSAFGPAKVHAFQYQPKMNMKIGYKPLLHRYLVFRSAVMADLFNAIKKKKIRFPSWEDYKTPFVDDFLAITQSYSNAMRIMIYDKPRDRPDDTFHSMAYAFLASMLDHPRPDILVPMQESGPSAEDEQRLMEEVLAAVDPGELY